MIKIGAVIILFNPDIHRLNDNIEAVIGQVDKVVLVDNGSANIETVKEKYADNSRISLITNKENVGIAKALNQGVAFCQEDVKWVLTLDQDSVSSANLIDEFSKFLEEPRVGILTPQIHDRHEKEQVQLRNGFKEINRCITSGALINVETWEEVGKFDETMFIDVVDFEYSYRIRQSGYRILQVDSTYLLHECGNIKEVVFFRKRIKIFNHSPKRRYYFSRNWIYFFRKYKGEIPRMYILKQYVVLCGKILFFEHNRAKKMQAIMRGIKDGLHMNIPCRQHNESGGRRTSE